MFRQVILLLAFIAAVSAFAPFAAKTSNSALFAGKPATKKVTTKKAAAPVKPNSFLPEGVGNFLKPWGGRPDPTPEMQAPEKPSALSAAWRYNKK